MFKFVFKTDIFHQNNLNKILVPLIKPFLLDEKRKKTASSSPLQDESVDEDDYMDEDMKSSDKAALDRILMILNDYESEMKNYVPPQAEEVKQGNLTSDKYC